jgi:hypothetical protein
MGQDAKLIHRPTGPAAVENEFNGGMKADAKALGDALLPDGEVDWIPEFSNEKIDLVLAITGDKEARINERWAVVEKIFGIGTEAASAAVVYRKAGRVREGALRGHEQCVFFLIMTGFALSVLW